MERSLAHRRVLVCCTNTRMGGELNEGIAGKVVKRLASRRRRALASHRSGALWQCVHVAGTAVPQGIHSRHPWRSPLRAPALRSGVQIAYCRFVEPGV